MHTILPLNLPTLTAEELKGYQQLLDEPYWPCLQGKDPLGLENSQLYAVGATLKGSPIGLAIAVHRPYLYQTILLSLMVEKSHRHQGIGTQLLIELEKILAKNHCRAVSMTYLGEQPTTPFLDNILDTLGWSAPKLKKVRFHFTSKTFHPDWVFKEYPLPKGYAIFPWKNLKPKERNRLLHLHDEQAFPSNVSPFKKKGQFEPLNSLGLKKRGEIIGWVITLRPDPDTIDYASVFIFPQYKYFGYAIHLLAASIRIHLQSPIEKGTAEFILDDVDSNWVRFMKIRLKPYAVQIDRYFYRDHIIY